MEVALLLLMIALTAFNIGIQIRNIKDTRQIEKKYNILLGKYKEQEKELAFLQGRMDDNDCEIRDNTRHIKLIREHMMKCFLGL